MSWEALIRLAVRAGADRLVIEIITQLIQYLIENAPETETDIDDWIARLFREACFHQDEGGER